MYYHQVQLALLCCRDLCTFADFMIYHVATDTYYMERITLSQEYIPKFDKFYKEKVVPTLLA